MGKGMTAKMSKNNKPFLAKSARRPCGQMLTDERIRQELHSRSESRAYQRMYA
jgi:hypothetical protein